MILSYEYFTEKMVARIKSDQQFYNELLITVLQNPNRYTGIFRLSNAMKRQHFSIQILVANIQTSSEPKNE